MSTTIRRTGTMSIIPQIELEHVNPVYRGGKVAKFVTTITVGMAAELFETGKIEVDWDIQRGKKTVRKADGTEVSKPMVDMGRVREIAQRIFDGDLFGGSLCWNLRPNVEYRHNPEDATLVILKGKPTLPDSSHRHHSFVDVLRIVREQGQDRTVLDYGFPLVIELLSEEEEKQLFYEYNQLGKPANRTRSDYLNQTPLHNRLTTQVVEKTILGREKLVELVTNSISKNSTRVVTYGTLASAIRDSFETFDETIFDAVRDYLVEFVEHLATVRNEVGYLPLIARQAVRANSIADSALAFHTYFGLAGELYENSDWREVIDRLGQTYQHVVDGNIVYESDFFARVNPLWKGTLLMPNRNGGLNMVNRSSSREFLMDQTRRFVGLSGPTDPADSE